MEKWSFMKPVPGAIKVGDLCPAAPEVHIQEEGLQLRHKYLTQTTDEWE